MECVLVCVHVQCVHVEVVASHAQALKHLLQGEPLAIPEQQQHKQMDQLGDSNSGDEPFSNLVAPAGCKCGLQNVMPQCPRTGCGRRHMQDSCTYFHSASHAHPRQKCIPEYDQFVRLLAQFAFDETQQVLLVHARTVVDVSVNLQQQQHITAQQC